jgi:hypothetical protein
MISEDRSVDWAEQKRSCAAVVQNVQKSTWAQQASCSVCTTGTFLGMRLPTHLSLVPSLRMSGATPPLPHIVIMVCTVALLLALPYQKC